MSKLDNLLDYYEHSRQMGHTTFMLEGIRYDRPAIILFANNAHARDCYRQVLTKYSPERPNHANMQIGEVQFKTIGLLDNTERLWRGQHTPPPIIVDHFALRMLVEEHTKSVLEKVVKK